MVFTFGKTDIGASQKYTSVTSWMGNKFTLSENGTVTALSVYVKNAVASMLKFAIFEDDGTNNRPNTLVWGDNTGISIPADGDNAWHSKTGLSIPLTVGDYWLCWMFNSDSNSLACEDTGGFRAWTAHDFEDDWVSGDWSNYATNSNEISIYATYTPSGGLPIPVAMHHYGHHINKIIRG